MRLEGRVAIITGGASGLGKAAALRFAQEGAEVVVADFNFEAADQLATQINNDHNLEGYALAVQVDVSSPESVKQMIGYVIEEFGKIDILINNAGIIMDAKLEKMTQDKWDRVIAVNLTGVFNCTQAVVPYMKEGGFGRIINTSSIVGTSGNFGQTNYSATKAGVIAMAKTWAKELGKYGITSNAVAFGFMLSPMTESIPEKVLKMMEDKVPLKRLGTPEDAANIYLFLASNEASYINGTVVEVDGGLSI